MLISRLADAIGGRLIGHDTEISGVQYHSGRVVEGDLFCCVVGALSDGHDFARLAIENGAAALLVERELAAAIPQIVVENVRIKMAEAAAEFYGNPSRSMKVIGITGTNGKTSTTYMLKAIAEAEGLKTGVIGTIKNLIGDKQLYTEHSTPESVDLQRILATMRDEGVSLVAMEVSSSGLDLHRAHCVEFAAAVFTNLTRDHLDYHKTFEAYFEAKKKLFDQTECSILNIDDAYGKSLVLEQSVPTTTFGIRENAMVYASDIDISTSGVHFELHMNSKKGYKLNVPIPGLFTVYNALGAAAAAKAVGISDESICSGLNAMKSVSGRLEPLETYGRDFSVFLDYAHTPDALENILNAVRSFATGRVVVLFGCGGDRDKAKRPQMGEVAGRLADFLIVTSDNPRTEAPMDIINSVLDGVLKTAANHIVIEDRLEAIKYALANAQKDDAIILAGKGHENYQITKLGKHHFDEKEIVAELLMQKS